MNLAYGYGPHLMADIESGDFDRLNDFDLVQKFLNEMPEKIGMVKISGPYVINYKPEINIDEQGITGVVIIAESHISIHTYPFYRYAFVDVFSCKPFSIDDSLNMITDYFLPEKIDHQVNYRGVNFPRYK